MAGPENEVKQGEVSGGAAARGTEANKFVGTPAVGTSKAAAAAGLKTVGPENSEQNRQRRRLVWSCVVAFLAAWFLAFFRFFLPRTLFEPATTFKICYPSDYGLGVDTKWQQISHLGGPYAGPAFRDLCSMHPPGLHARLEAERE